MKVGSEWAKFSGGSECPSPPTFGVKMQLLDTVKARKLAYYGHTVKDNANNNDRCLQPRKTTHGLERQHQDVDRTPCGRVNQNVIGRDKWRRYVHGVANHRIKDG